MLVCVLMCLCVCVRVCVHLCVCILYQFYEFAADHEKHSIILSNRKQCVMLSLDILLLTMRNVASFFQCFLGVSV